MADNDIEIKVKVDANGAITIFDKLGKKIGETTSASDEGSRGFNRLEKSIISLNQGLDLLGKGYKFLTEASSKAMEVLDRGSAVADLEEAFDGLANKAGIASDVFLNQLNKATADTISNFDLMKKSNELLQAGLKPDAILEVNKAARVFAESGAVSMQEAIDGLSQSLLRGDDRFLRSRGIIIDNEKAYKDYAESLGKNVKNITESGKAEAIRQAVLKETAKVAQGAAKIQEDAGDRVQQINKIITDSFDGIKKKIAGNDGVLKFLGEFANGLKIVIPKAVEAAVDALNTLGRVFDGTDDKFSIGLKVIKNWANNLVISGGHIKSFDLAVAQTYKELNKQTEAAKNSTKALVSGKDATKGHQAALEDLAVFIGKTSGGIGVMTAAVEKDTKGKKDNAKSTKDAADANAHFGNTAEITEDKIRDLTDAAADFARNGAEKMNRSIDEAFKKSRDRQRDGSIFDSLFMGADSSSQYNDIMMDAVSESFNILSDGISDSKTRDDGKKVVKAIDEALYTAWGFALGGPVGAVLGNVVGKIAGKIDAAIYDRVVKTLLGGGNKETDARKAADKFFADIFEANRLAVVVDGQLKEIKDLVFGKGTDIFTSGTFDDAFQGLPDAAQGAFAGVGTAFEEFINNADLASGQLAAVLVNNIGGSLNNLQLFVQATGKSFEDLNTTIVDAFLDGKLSALEAQSALLGIQQIAQKGIPDGIGFTVQAMENLFAAGTKGGRAVVDALGDIGAEALELGIKDLPTLQANLAASGKFTADQITKVFAALQANGIDSVEKLSNATAEQLIPVLSQLQAEGVLTEANKTAADLVTTIEKLPASKDIEINLRVNASQSDRNLLNQVSSGKLGGSGEGTAPLR